MQSFAYRFLLIGLLFQFSYSVNPQLLKDTEKHYQNKLGSWLVTKEQIENSIELATRFTGYLETFEKIIAWPSRITPDSPTHGFFLSYEPEWKAIERGRQALLATKSSQQLGYACVLGKDFNMASCNDIIVQNSFFNTSLKEVCRNVRRKCTREEIFKKYRTIDGACNHVITGNTGESFTAYNRLLKANYLNFYETPKRSATKAALPSPRKISNAVVRHEEDPHEYLTSAFHQFGQFVEHDLSRFATSIMIHLNQSFSCCDSFGYDFAPRYKHPLCMSIPIPSDDPYYSKKRVQCLSYARSLPVIKSDCSMGYLEQQNQATHYLDGSQIYGSNIGALSRLRSGKKGQLRVNKNNFLPLADDPRRRCQLNSENGVCFTSGDYRVNVHPLLTVMYTLWTREHNRIAEELSKLNANWDDEKLFGEARRIVVAELQHITYYEWLKHLLGKKQTEEINRVKYTEQLDPSVSNEFAAAAVRSLNSMFPENITMVDRNRKTEGSLKMYEHFNKPEIITQGDVFDSLIRGLATQETNNIGRHFSADLTNKYFFANDYGYDILSLDIQRGRDHGLQGYNSYRKYCGLKRATTFDDFEDVMLNKNAEVLLEQYQHVDDVDLLIGGLLEKPSRNSLVGPTFSCIIAHQFSRTRRGDRYFFDNANQPMPFTSYQLDEIRKVRLANIFCENSNIGTIQSEVFKRIANSNELVSCDSLPKINLNLWRIPDSR